MAARIPVVRASDASAPQWLQVDLPADPRPVATLDADPSARAKAIRGLLRHTPASKNPEESALRALAAISE